jgi:hypothetical protein
MSAEQFPFEGYRRDLIQRAADTGMQVAAYSDPDYQEAALAAIRDLAAMGAHFSADDVTRACGPAPSKAALGAAFRRAARAREIECVGFMTSDRVSRHGGLQRLWRGVHE